MNFPTEPSAELRDMAATLWQMYIALKSQGFSEQQALVIIGQILAAGQSGAS